MDNTKVIFNGYKLNKTDPNRESLYDNSCFLHREDEVVKESYKAANTVYSNTNWDGASGSREDFRQEAAMYIIKKFRSGYFDGSRKNLFPIIYRLIDGYFAYNTKKSMDRESLVETSLNRTFSTRHDSDIEYLQLLADTRHRYAIEDVIHGENCIVKIIGKLDPKPIPTRKHKYQCELDGKAHKLNEALVGALLVSGRDLHYILDIFDCGTSWSGGSSRSAYIAKIVSRTKYKILEEVKGLPEEAKESVVGYFSDNSIVNFL